MSVPTYYADVSADGVVERVIVASPQFVTENPNGWVQTWPDGGSRKNFAGVGYSYDRVRDAFIPPRPSPDSALDEATCRWLPTADEIAALAALRGGG